MYNGQPASISTGLYTPVVLFRSLVLASALSKIWKLKPEAGRRFAPGTLSTLGLLPPRGGTYTWTAPLFPPVLLFQNSVSSSSGPGQPYSGADINPTVMEIFFPGGASRILCQTSNVSSPKYLGQFWATELRAKKPLLCRQPRHDVTWGSYDCICVQWLCVQAFLKIPINCTKLIET